MSKSAKRLGRGLSSLVPNLRADQNQARTAVASLQDTQSHGTDIGLPDESGISARMMSIDTIDANPYQPRTDVAESEIASLADSIRQSGILQPLAVRRNGQRFQIIAGERRLRAAKVAGLAEVPVVIKTASDEQMIEWALVENIQREDLNAIDRAKAYEQLSDHFSLRPEDVAKRVGEDRSTVANYLRLLDLPEAIQRLVASGSLGMGHARCLLGIANQSDQWNLAEAAARNELSVRALEQIVRRKKSQPDAGEARGSRGDAKGSAHAQELQRRFEEALKTKVTIQEGKRKGTGRIIIQYYTLDDFDRVADALGVHLD